MEASLSSSCVASPLILSRRLQQYRTFQGPRRSASHGRQFLGGGQRRYAQQVSHSSERLRLTFLPESVRNHCGIPGLPPFPEVIRSTPPLPPVPSSFPRRHVPDRIHRRRRICLESIAHSRNTPLGHLQPTRSAQYPLLSHYAHSKVIPLGSLELPSPTTTTKLGGMGLTRVTISSAPPYPNRSPIDFVSRLVGYCQHHRLWPALSTTVSGLLPAQRFISLRVSQ